jgi:serine/threonine protein kinase
MSKNAPITAQTPLPAPAPSHDELGPLVGKSFGGYEVTSYIGEGATGAVYRAEDLMGERMAVKVMHRELSRKEHSEKLWHDLQALNALEDDHFVRVYDCGFGDDGEFFYTMDELTGVDLEAALEESGALAPRRAVEIVEQLCTALARAHKAGVVHGGLKPRNVFLCPVATGGGTLVVKVLDFGAARLAGGVDKGVIVGNPFYMAPEQFGGHADERTDVYSLGVIMYELFSGTLPFNGPTHGQVMMRHLAEPPGAPPGVDELLARIILKALHKAQSDRFSSVEALHKALAGWAKGARTLEDAAASHVIARASQARKVKQAALTTPDATAPMGKIDVTELANATRQQLEPAKTPRGSRNGMQTTTRKEDTQNSPESVEASLEDFISQANATFPTSDGWDLHTGDVELVDDEPDDEARLEEDEHVSAPIVVKPRKSEPSGQVLRKSDKSARMRKAASATPAHAHSHSKMDETPLPPPKAQTTMVDSGPNPSKRRGSPFEPSLALDLNDEAEPLDPPPTGPKRRAERTEVVSSPLPRVVPWTANPIVWVGGMFAAFVAGSVLVFTMVKAMMPAPQQAPVIVQQAPAAPQQASAPVVTPLGGQAQVAATRAAAPVVTPLAAPRAPTPEEVPPTMAQERQQQHRAPAVRHVAKAESSHVAAAAPRRGHAAAAASDDDDDEAPAAPRKAKKEGGSKGAKGGDWVDPFAQ